MLESPGSLPGVQIGQPKHHPPRASADIGWPVASGDKAIKRPRRHAKMTRGFAPRQCSV
jgi:hypothetical protein